MQLDSVLSAFAFALPFGGIALGWLSFRWAELGAAPDGHNKVESGLGRADDQLQIGIRYRGRWCARVCFDAGALLLAAAVPMEAAAAHPSSHPSLSAIGALLIIGFAAVYGTWQAIHIWQHRRRDAFNLYFSKDMFFMYDRSRTEQIYFRLNRMPIWSLPDRGWFAKCKLPNIDKVYATASKFASTIATAPKVSDLDLVASNLPQ